MDTCPISCGRRQINCWRKQKSGTTTNKSIYNQQDLFSGEGPEDWSTVIICSFHWIIFCSRVLLKEMRQISNVHLNVLLIIFSNKKSFSVFRGVLKTIFVLWNQLPNHNPIIIYQSLRQSHSNSFQTIVCLLTSSKTESKLFVFWSRW